MNNKYQIAYTLLLSADDDSFRDDVKELKKLDQKSLYDALKSDKLKDQIELDEENKEFLSKVSKGTQSYTFYH